MVSRIGRLLGFSCVEYWLEEANLFPDISNYGKKHVSLCRDFLNDGELFLSIYRRGVKSEEKKSIDFWLDYARNTFPKEYLFQLLMLDAIVGNTDRHLNNFGYVVDIKTSEYRAAPIFDTGASLLAWVDSADLDSKSKMFVYDKSKPFRSKHSKQIKLVEEAIKLEHISFEQIIYEISDVLQLLSWKRAQAITDYLKWRCNKYGNIT
jgi:hypothetical protein